MDMEASPRNLSHAQHLGFKRPSAAGQVDQALLSGLPALVFERVGRGPFTPRGIWGGDQAFGSISVE